MTPAFRGSTWRSPALPERLLLWRVLLCLLLALPVVAPAAGAAPLTRDKVPEPLRPWIDWVLQGHEDAACPLVATPAVASDGNPAAARECLWPARLDLDLGDGGGRFEQTWQVFRDGFVPLPGDLRAWPLDVRVDGRPAAITTRGTEPSVRLDRGRHVLTGRFEWTALPPALHVPPATGLLSLRVRGRGVALPSRDAGGSVWLEKRAGAAAAESRLDLTVSRMLDDEVPLLLTTRIDLRVSGTDREATLGRALPAGFVPVAIDSPIPARLDPSGRLVAQVRAGSWTLLVQARHEGPAAAIPTVPGGDAWPADEVWVLQSRPALRQIVVEGPPALDPQQTTLPDEWKALPAYLVRAGETLRLVEKQRGDAAPAPDHLRLQRTLWLDFDGGGFTQRDHISGVFVRSWRLQMPPPGVPGRVAIGGADQAITRRGSQDPPGVEVRQGRAEIEADSRVEGSRSSIPAVGWDTDFQEAAADLWLPPGWRLLHATGVDDIDATWVSTWTLLDLFLVLVLTLAAGRLWGWPGAAVALLALGLSWIEPGAPRWSWVALIAATALVRVLPEGRLRKGARVVHLVAVVALLLVLVPFLAMEARTALHPALRRPLPAGMAGGIGVLMPAGAPAGIAGGRVDARLEAKNAPRAERTRTEVSAEMIQSLPILGRNYQDVLTVAPGVTDEAAAEQSANLAPDPKATAATGPGIPTWEWRHVGLSWRGPVERGQRIGLVLLSPVANGAIGWLRVFLQALLAIVVLRGLRRPGGAGATPAMTRAATAAGASLIAFALLAGAPARADTPPQEMLDALRARLLAPPDCLPDCLALPRLAIEADTATLRLRVEMHAAASVAAPLPGDSDQWTPARVFLDGAPAEGLARGADGRLRIALAPGVHQVLMEGPLPDRDTISIPLPVRPGRVAARAAGWRVEGLGEDGTTGGALQLTRLARKASTHDGTEPAALPPFLRIERDIALGLRWEIRTHVVRLSPTGRALVLEVPLVGGESVTSAGVRVAGGKAIIDLGPGAREAGWTSSLAVADTVRLGAPESVPWTESWRVAAGPSWHLEVEGIPPIHAGESEEIRTRTWRPWPGETVVLHVTRPEAVPGRTLTIDATTLKTRPGLRMTETTLDLRARAARGGEHVVTLPEGAVLQAVLVNGTAQPIRQDGRRVVLPVVPGAQAFRIDWTEPHGIRTSFRAPDVEPGDATVNAETVVEMPADRWILAVGGPRLGPAVLFWSLLVVCLMAAAGLGATRWTPLRWRHWFLLSLGLTQVPLWAPLLIAGWLLALGWRRREPRPGPLAFDAVQVALAGWTVAAIAALFWAIQQGLLGLPEMQIAGNGSSALSLHWYLDRTTGTLPRPWVLSVPLLVYRLAMLAWALWLAWSILRWLRWGWECWSDGGYWQRPHPRGGGAVPPVMAPPEST